MLFDRFAELEYESLPRSVDKNAKIDVFYKGCKERIRCPTQLIFDEIHVEQEAERKEDIGAKGEKVKDSVINEEERDGMCRM